MSFQTQQPVASVFVLPRARLELFEDADDCELGASALVIKQLENVRLSDRFDAVRTKFTGVPHPEPFHLAEEHSISADGIWDIAAAMQRNHDYILVITWQEGSLKIEANSAWHRLYYFKARIDATEAGSRDSNEFTGTLNISASYTDTDNGTGVPPAP